MAYNNGNTLNERGYIILKKQKKISFIVLITLAITFINICINKLIFCFSSKSEKLYLPNSNYYDWRFGKIYYTKNGQGKPLILIHDLDSSQSSYEFKFLIRKLEKHYTVYTIDLIGFGKSDKPKLTYTNFLFVQLLSDFITNIVKQKSNLVCVGKSTTIGVTVCNYNPGLINKLLFINTPSLETMNKIPRQSHKINKLLLESTLTGTTVYNYKYSKYALNKSLKSKVHDKSSITANYILARNEAAHLSGEASKFTEGSIQSHFTNLNITKALRSINNSMYFISGEYFEDGNRILNEYCELNPSIETDIIPDTKDLPWIENPNQLAEFLLIYI